MLAAPGSLRGSQIQMLHDLILGNVVLVYFLMIFRVILILWFDFPAELGFPLLFRNFETTGEAAPFFIQKLWDLLLSGILNLILHIRAYFRHFALWIDRTHAEAR